MASIFYSGLSKDLSLILNDSDDYNVIIRVGENQNTKEFRAHSLILRARSPYFKSAFSADWTSRKNNIITFNKPNITPNIFDMILKYVYTGELDFTIQSGEDILGLLVASDELLIDELFMHVQDYLIEKRTVWVKDNFILVLRTVFKLSSCKKLQDYCLEFICKDLQQFITSKKFSSLDKDILIGLLKRDDLHLDEIAIWDFLIKWGIKQINFGNENIGTEEWNRKLMTILDQFIPLIRFVKISPIDYFDKVRPYKAIIPHHICEEIEEFYFKGTLPKITSLPPRTGIVSTIIKPKLATIIANWIDNCDPTTLLRDNDNYKFNRIYLMSRDGFNNVTFYSRCNEQGPFVVLISVQSKKIYGGYNPIGYAGRRDRWLPSSRSFIFSFENDQDVKDMKISRVVNTACSVYDNLNYKYFFCFGGDLYINGQYLNIGYNTTYYNNVFSKQKEIVEEIEVFSVAKK